MDNSVGPGVLEEGQILCPCRELNHGFFGRLCCSLVAIHLSVLPNPFMIINFWCLMIMFILRSIFYINITCIVAHQAFL